MISFIKSNKLLENRKTGIKSLNKLFILIVSFMCILLSVFSMKDIDNGVLFADELDFDAKAYCLLEANSNMVLNEMNSDEKLEVASMVKLMTSLLTMEKIEKGEWSLDMDLMVSNYAASMEGSQAFLDAGKSYKIGDLLKSVIMASANDSSVVLAENYAGGEENFVVLMNERAKQLGMENTLYANATGLPAFSQYSTARDIANLLNVVSKHSLYKKYSSIWMDKLVHSSGRITELVNTNRLIKYYPGCECGKTGFTDEAGYCLSASVIRGNMHLISVVMGAKTSSDRFNISSNLLNYGFNNFRASKLIEKGKIIDSKYRLKGMKDDVLGIVDRDIVVVQKITDKTELDVNCVFDKFSKEVKKDNLIGKVYVLKDGKTLAEANILAKDSYKSPAYIETIKQIGEKWRIG